MKERKRELKRLDAGFYRGTAMVHWTMTMTDRRSGWLGDQSHARFRETMLHCQHRYKLLCPAYCLMPDHLHVLLLGLSDASDQLRAISFFRRYFNASLELPGFELQKQPFDHVLKEAERERGAFESLMFYITANPERAGLVEDARDWAYSGALAAGYPDFDWRDAKFTEKFWGVYVREVRDGSGSGESDIGGAGSL